MNKVAIIGMTESMYEAPFGDKNWEFWGLNNLYQYLPKVKFNRWFEIHKFSMDTESKRMLRRGCSIWRGLAIEQYLADLQNLGIPVYMQEECQIISNAMVYPKKEILSRFDSYFACTHSWMAALAIASGYSTIGVYGVDMDHPNYKDKRPCFEHLLGIAKGIGIEVIVAPSCKLLKYGKSNKLYGFEE